MFSKQIQGRGWNPESIVLDSSLSIDWNMATYEIRNPYYNKMIGILMSVTGPDTYIPRLFGVILPVNDIEKAQEFYSSLLYMEGKRVSPGRHYFQCGGTILACFNPRRDGDNFDLSPNPDHIYFSVKNLNDVYSRAQALRAIILDEIGTRPWGETSFYLKDPFGNKICLVQEETVFTGN